MSLATRLYRGEISYDFIGRRRRWYAGSGLIIALGLASLLFRGLHLGIDFKGGDAFQFAANGHSVATATSVLNAQHIANPVVQRIGENQIRIQTAALSQDPANDQVAALATGLARAYGLDNANGSPNADAITVETVGASWGSQITHKAVEGLIIFLIAVMFYITVRFTGKMAVAAMVALVHDLVITAGIYSLVGFEVSPATVIAVLTILGFSLYDTVVVFDKVRENTADLTPRSTHTYTAAANLAVNQTIMRSINTSLIALLPVAALLFVGAGLLGAGTLKDLALAQFVGLAAGAYSSIFIATPLLAQLKEREPMMRELQQRVAFLAMHKPKAVAVAGSGSPLRSAAPVAARQPERSSGASVVVTVQEPVPADPLVAAVPARVPGAPMQRPAARRRRHGRPGRPSGKRKR